MDESPQGTQTSDALKGLRNCAPSSFDGKRMTRSFAQQVDDYAYGRFPSGDHFLLALSTHELGLPEADDLPVLMTQRTMRKIQHEHDLGLDFVAGIPQMLREHPLALESIAEMDALVVVLDAVDKSGNDVICALHLNLDKGNKTQNVEVNEIASVYGKRNLGWLIENTARAERAIYVNGRTREWLRRTGVPFPQRMPSSLIDEYTLLHPEKPQGPDKSGESEDKPEARATTDGGTPTGAWVGKAPGFGHWLVACKEVKDRAHPDDVAMDIDAYEFPADGSSFEPMYADGGYRGRGYPDARTAFRDRRPGLRPDAADPARMEFFEMPFEAFESAERDGLEALEDIAEEALDADPACRWADEALAFVDEAMPPVPREWAEVGPTPLSELAASQPAAPSASRAMSL